jgi:hypothetical protein
VDRRSYRDPLRVCGFILCQVLIQTIQNCNSGHTAGGGGGVAGGLLTIFFKDS